MSGIESRFFADMGALTTLKARAAGDSPETLREVARQFESVFTRMLLKNMRAASFGDGLFDSQQGEFYRDMFDQQLSLTLSGGRGLGIADLLVSQLGGGPAPRPVSRQAPASMLAAASLSGEQPAGTHTADFSPDSPMDFVRELMPHARAAATRLGVAPQLMLAQAALETGWGAHPIRTDDGAPANNLFGIKAGRGWQGPAAMVNTLEFVGGLPSRGKAAFRVYESVADSFRDYADLLLNSQRYRDALGKGDDAAAFGGALQAGGYATDPDYAAKIDAIVRSPTLNDAIDALKQAR